MRIYRAVAVAGLLVAVAPAASQVTLSLNVWVPPAHPLVSQMTLPYCKDIEAVTQGRVKCQMLPKAVAAPPQTFDAVKDGLADISFAVHGYTPGRFVLSDAVEFPLLGDTAEVTSVAYQRIYERMLAKFDEHKGVVTLAVFTHGPGQIYSNKKALVAIRDFEGLKIRVGGGVVNDVTTALGAVPILKPASEV